MRAVLFAFFLGFVQVSLASSIERFQSYVRSTASAYAMPAARAIT